MSEETTKQITKNCHYISQFLTRPWEFEDQRGKGQLHYYDFDTDKFESRFAKNLFAKTDLNSPAVETWLTEVLESPLAAVRPRLAAADPNALDDRRFFRAAVLMLWMQGIRSNSVGEDASKRALEDMAAMTTEQLDYMVSMIQRDYNLHVAFTVTKGSAFYPLSVPSEGTFIVSVRDEGCMSGYSLGVGLPLDPKCALVAIPVENQGKIDLSLLSPSLANYSVGISPSRRVVLHPGVWQSFSEDQLRRDLRELRGTNDTLQSSVHEVRQKMREGFGMVGIVPASDRIGRIIPER